jgi:uncharacterized protein YciI
MYFLLNVTIPSLEKAKPHLQGHMEFLNNHFDSGFFKMFGPYLPGGTGGYAVIEASSLKEVEETLAADPLTKANACSNEIHEIALGRISSDLTEQSK